MHPAYQTILIHIQREVNRKGKVKLNYLLFTNQISNHLINKILWIHLKWANLIEILLIRLTSILKLTLLLAPERGPSLPLTLTCFNQQMTISRVKFFNKIRWLTQEVLCNMTSVTSRLIMKLASRIPKLKKRVL